MKNIFRLTFLSVLLIAAFTVTAFAASYSANWYEDSNGWHIKDGSGATIKNAWVCDDVQDPTRNTWYLIDGNGNMVSNPLVKDGTGNHYSLETAHDGYYGMLWYKNGTYDGVALTFEQSHNGSFGAVIGGLDALKSKYSVKDISNINNSNCVYTSSFGTGKGSSASINSSSNGMSRTYYLENLVMKSSMSMQDRIPFVQNAVNLGLTTWEKGCLAADEETYNKLSAFLTSFDWPNMKDKQVAETCFNRIACGKNGNTYSRATTAEGNWPVFMRKHGVCSDYASELARLCRLAGLEAEYYEEVPNSIDSEGNLTWGHAITKIKLDGKWYTVDPTNDSTFYPIAY